MSPARRAEGSDCAEGFDEFPQRLDGGLGVSKFERRIHPNLLTPAHHPNCQKPTEQLWESSQFCKLSQTVQVAVICAETAAIPTKGTNSMLPWQEGTPKPR
eukprot:gene14719-603_t